MGLVSKFLGQIGVSGSQSNPANIGYLYGLTLGAGGLTNAGPTNEQGSVVVVGNVATYAPTAAQSGTLFVLNRAAGTTVTLPAPAVGLKYSFVVQTSVTSNNYKVITDAGTTFLQGALSESIASGAPNVYVGDGSTHIAVTMNGTTTGGLKSTRLTLECITATLWQVTGVSVASGTIATPFATS